MSPPLGGAFCWAQKKGYGVGSTLNPIREVVTVQHMEEGTLLIAVELRAHCVMEFPPPNRHGIGRRSGFPQG